MLHAITDDKVAASRDELLKKWSGDTQYATGTASEAVAEDGYFLSQIQAALKHITWVIANSNYMNGIDKTTRMIRVNTWYDSLFIAVIAVSAAVTIILLGFNVALKTKKTKENS